MSDSDLQLLQRYTRQHAEDAFAELVRRHLDLVFSAALRQVRSPQLAEEVAQSAFSDLARQAHQFAPDTILTAWLYQVTRRTAIDVVRREARRQAREQAACELNAMNADAAADWTHIEPLLDEAMQELDDPDRAAVLLRYFENKSLRDVGQTLGTTEDAARKRVTRAVDRLREFFSKRGVTVGTSGLAALVSANAVHAAPAGLAATISASAALAGAALAATATATATKTIVMTTLQKTLIATAFAAAVGTGIYEARQVSRLRDENQTLQQQRAPLADQVQQLQRERDEAVRQLAALRDDQERLHRDATELVRLRGEVARLRATEQQPPQLKEPATKADDPFTQSVLVLTARAADLNQYLAQMPDRNIPEIRFLRESDWLEVAREANFQSEAEIRKSLSRLRSVAKNRFGVLAAGALDKYIKANDGQLPDDPSQLKAYFEVPVDEAVLQRYRMLHTGKVNDLPKDTIYVISEKAPVDRDYDSHLYIGPKGRSGSWGTGLGQKGDPDETWATR